MSKHNDDCAGRNGVQDDGKHTPGPWHRDITSGGRCDVRAENGRKVALCWGLSTTKAAQVNSQAYRAECDANARLIAAAPELLAVLESAEGILSRSGYAEWPGGSIAEIRAAIAKAEGRS